MAISYKDSGVDVERGYKAVELMKKHVQSTFDKNVLGDIGSFGGFYPCGGEDGGAVLVAGTDGVGTKLKYAFLADKHDTVGIDAVAMCVNDIVCQGAKPLFFLDYFATGKLSPRSLRPSFRAWRRAAVRQAARSSAARLPKCPGSTPTGSTISRALPSASWIRKRSSTERTSKRATRSSASRPAGSIPTVIRSCAACSVTAAIRTTSNGTTTA